MCAAGSKVAQCADVTGITVLPPTKVINDQVSQLHTKQRNTAQSVRGFGGGAGGSAVLRSRRGKAVQRAKASEVQRGADDARATQRSMEATASAWQCRWRNSAELVAELN
jgi:GR25 family glycosyltransferase involved in LPS biosynthesis